MINSINSLLSLRRTNPFQIEHPDTDVSRAIRRVEQNRESNLRFETAKKVEELVSEPQIMQRWREEVSLTSKRPEVCNVKNYKDVNDVWQKWLHNFNPETHIDVLYTLLAFCHDDFLRMNLIINDSLKKQLLILCENQNMSIYYRFRLLDIYLSHVIRNLASINLSKTNEMSRRNMLMKNVSSSQENWEAIKSEYDISKMDFGKKINFVKDPFKRKVIFRDVEQAFVLVSQGFSKPAIILAGGVIEELLRLYLDHKNIKMKSDDSFFDYIKACEDNRFLKRGVLRLTDSVRDFRNLVHLAKETEKKHTISKATAKGAVSSIFTIANDFQ
jgi:hypothetical protein